jgi:transcriptional regulator with XRE-family HTH domain
MRAFPDNLRRLMGLHDVTARELSKILGLSEAAFSTWFTGTREPNFKTAMTISAFFEIPPDRLATAQFGELLNDLDAEWFDRVQVKIHRSGEQLRAL